MGIRSGSGALLAALLSLLSAPGAVVGQLGSLGGRAVLEVVDAGTFRVEAEGREKRWRLAGVWVPSPPEEHAVGHYRGAEARRQVEDWLAQGRLSVSGIWTPDGRRLYVRMGLSRPEGKAGTFDLAEALARWGWALCDRSTTGDAAHAEAICAAEREARRERLGIHDGGFAEHDRRRESTIDLGQLLWAGTTSDPGSEGEPPDPDAAVWWTTADDREALGDPEDSIRDYGRSMGLPPDASKRGQ